MGGTLAGGIKARNTNISKYGDDFYKNIGAKGGKASNTGGFAYMKARGMDDKIREAGRKGGRVSKRKKGNSMNKVLLHGENVFKPVETEPKGKVGRFLKYIAGHSESGHHHVIESDTEFEIIEGEKEELYVRLFEPAKVVHQKSFEIHETMTLQPGVYEIYPALEYNPFDQIMQRQFD